MNNKNISISISLLITSLFFTFVFYFGYKNFTDNYNSYRNSSIYDAQIKTQTTPDVVDKLKNIDNIAEVGQLAVVNKSAKLDDKTLFLNYQDLGFNKMLEDGILREGEFPTRDNEISISNDIADQLNLKVGDKIALQIGDRISKGVVIDPVSSVTKDEQFKPDYIKEFLITGITRNTVNKNMKISYATTSLEGSKAAYTFFKFENFKKAYEKKDILEQQLKTILNKDKVELEFSNTMKNYYNVDESFIRQNTNKIMDGFAVLVTLSIFIFFVKNIFTVWGLKKIKEISMYKSIGSTDFQIFKLLLKEGIKISFIPIIIGHILGFFSINLLYILIQNIYSKMADYDEVLKFIEFKPILSAIVIVFCFLIIFVAIFAPSKRISKINIVEGLKGNFDIKDIKLKRNKDIWKELRINNLKSISSQRYISTLGVLIISIFLIILTLAKYNRIKSYYEYDTNVYIYYHSKDENVPEVLKNIIQDTKNDKAVISSTKYISLAPNLNFSKEFKDLKLKEKMQKYFDQGEDLYLDGYITALDDKTFEYLGGTKGEALLYNQVQTDPTEPLSTAEYTKYFSDIKKLNYSINQEKEYSYSIKIDKLINNLKDYRQRLLPYDVLIFVDFDTYFSLLDEWNKYYIENNDEKFRNTYELRMKVDDDNLDSLKETLNNKLDSSISYYESYNIITGDLIKEGQSTDIKTFSLMILFIAFIIFIFNVTNGYSSINLGLLSRKREIGSLSSCGIEKNDLKNKFTKEFCLEQLKSFIIVLILTIIIISIIAFLSPTINFKIMTKYFEYKYFILFSLIIYGLNIIIYRMTLSNILKKPIIDLIRNE